MSKRILIVSVKAGAGHVKAADALEEAFKNNKNCVVKNVELLEYAKTFVKYFYGEMSVDVAKNSPQIYGYFYENYELLKEFIKPKFLIDSLYLKSFLEMVENFKPDIIVCTHFIPADILVYYRKQANKNYKIVLIITDYEHHPAWLIKDMDLCCVAHEEMKKNLIYKGILENQILISGIPIGLQFNKPLDREALKRKYGLNNDKLTLLISAGSFGISPVSEIIKKLSDIKKPFQMIVICGHNQKQFLKLNKLKQKESRLKKVFGFVNNMEELMAVSDLLITKPGGITVSESLAMALPMLLIKPIPGQEEANADYLLEHGVAQKAYNLDALIYKTENLIKNKKELLKMSLKAKKISKPNASNDIVTEILKKWG
ncbi:MAG: glycosyltransferase [Candidatus Parcubacteria bacterium]|nr:glycosyltransferase [Candidatus Parcubacteria bacterium]